MTTPARISALHDSYQRLTGLHLGPLAWHDEYLWSAFTRHGWTEQDLHLVIAHIKKTYKYATQMLRLRLLIDPVNFREKLAEAMAMQRNAKPQPSAKTVALRQMNREPEQDMGRAKAVGDVAKDLTVDYQKLREQAGLI